MADNKWDVKIYVNEWIISYKFTIINHKEISLYKRLAIINI